LGDEDYAKGDETSHQTGSDGGKDGCNVRIGELGIDNVARREKVHGEEPSERMRSVPDAASDGTADEDTQDIEPGIEQKYLEVLKKSRKDSFFLSNRQHPPEMSFPSLSL